MSMVNTAIVITRGATWSDMGPTGLVVTLAHLGGQDYAWPPGTTGRLQLATGAGRVVLDVTTQGPADKRVVLDPVARREWWPSIGPAHTQALRPGTHRLTLRAITPDGNIYDIVVRHPVEVIDSIIETEGDTP